MSKKMLIVCDVEGTIFKAKYKIEGTDYASSMWQPIAHALGKKAEKEEYETHLRWENLEYDNYVDWVKATVNIHKKYKLKRPVFQKLIDEAEYMPGVEEFFKMLDRDKFIPVLITGGFRNLARRAEKELKIDSSNIFAACNYTFNNWNEEIQDVDIQPSDFEGKVSYVNTVLENYGLNPEEDWVFIGDGKNDIPIAELAPYSFAINGHKDLNEVVKNSKGKLIDDFFDAYYEICTFYDIINGDKSTDEYSKKSIELSIRRQIQRERLIENNLKLSAEIEQLKRRIEELETTFPKPTAVDEIIPFAKHYYGENIDFSKEAKRSLIENAEAGYTKKYIESVFEQLGYINNWAKMKKGDISQEEFEQITNSRKIKSCLSESTENMFKSEYTDSGVLINMHMYMSWLPNCDRPRTYFGWDKNHQKALISTMCEHKKTSKFKS